MLQGAGLQVSKPVLRTSQPLQLVPAQVSGKSAVRFFVASQGAVDPPAEAELKAHDDFVWLDMPKEQNYRCGIPDLRCQTAPQ